MAVVKKRRTPKRKSKVAHDKIDRLVVEQVDEDSASERPKIVNRRKFKSLSIPAELAARASFFARLHHENQVDKWMERVVRERVEIEESAFTAAKKISLRELS
jgi:hypothetical protein